MRDQCPAKVHSLFAHECSYVKGHDGEHRGPGGMLDAVAALRAERDALALQVAECGAAPECGRWRARATLLERALRGAVEMLEGRAPVSTTDFRLLLNGTARAALASDTPGPEPQPVKDTQKDTVRDTSFIDPARPAGGKP